MCAACSVSLKNLLPLNFQIIRLANAEFGVQNPVLHDKRVCRKWQMILVKSNKVTEKETPQTSFIIW